MRWGRKFHEEPFHVLLFLSLLISVLSSDVGPILSPTESALFIQHLDDVRRQEKYIHMVEFGGGLETIVMSQHSAIVSWNVVSDDTSTVSHLENLYEGSNRVTVKHIATRISARSTTPIDRHVDEGSFADSEKYISEIMYFGAKDRAAYWVANFGRARADVGIAALPLLVRTGGKMAVAGWSSHACFAETLLQFYDLVGKVDDLAILQPKQNMEFYENLLRADVSYDWCFSFMNGDKLLRYEAGPSNTGTVVTIMQQSSSIGCSDMVGGSYHCSDSVDGDCVSCYDALKTVSSRGTRLVHSVRQVAEILRGKFRTDL